MFPDMYLQYNHPTSKSQQKPFDKNRQNLIPLHPPQRRCHTPPTTHPPQRRCPSPPGTPQGNSAPATIQRSADSPHPPSTPQGNSAPAAIQRSADGPPPPGKPPHLTPPKTRTDRLPAGRLHGRASLHSSLPPTQKKSPQAKTPGNSPQNAKLKYPIIINRYQLSPTITQHAAETSESPSHWKPSQSQPQDS